MAAEVYGNDPSSGSNGSGRLSYKFQRLREQIRASVLNGEFGRRLPGERELGRRYNANAKTVNKALSDLSSEGLLVRRVGCGTFVAPSGGDDVPQDRKGIVVCIAAADVGAGRRYQQDTVKVLAEQIAERGQGLRFVSAGGEKGTRRTLVSAWPTSLRATTDALVFYPEEPLSGGVGTLDDEIVAEAYRRHVPMVAIGAFGPDARIGAVVPDYVDAGFRLAEYLVRIGSTAVCVILAAGKNRERELVLDGCRMAGVRYQRAIESVTLVGSDAAPELERRLSGDPGDRQTGREKGRRIGLICVGRRILEIVQGSPEIKRLRSDGQAAVTAMLEPADRLVGDTDITTYEVEPAAMTRWAARMISNARVGDRPLEISIRGSLRIRGGAWVATASGGQESL